MESKDNKENPLEFKDYLEKAMEEVKKVVDLSESKKKRIK